MRDLAPGRDGKSRYFASEGSWHKMVWIRDFQFLGSEDNGATIFNDEGRKLHGAIEDLTPLAASGYKGEPCGRELELDARRQVPKGRNYNQQ
jgi:hypothetical protein